MTSYEKYVAIRDRVGVTDYEVSKQTGISQSTLSEWRNQGKKNGSEPKVDKRLKIADYFNVSVTELIGD